MQGNISWLGLLKRIYTQSHISQSGTRRADGAPENNTGQTLSAKSCFEGFSAANGQSTAHASLHHRVSLLHELHAIQCMLDLTCTKQLSRLAGALRNA